jgi:hypothetical protein
VRASYVLYVLCFFLPAYRTPQEEAPAYMAFLLGPLAMLSFQFGWLANPLLVAAWVTLHKRKYKAALITAGLAVALALSFLLYPDITGAGANRYPYTALSGYYIWLASMTYVAIAAMTMFVRNDKPKEKTSNAWAAQVALAALILIPLALTAGPLLQTKYEVHAALARLCATATESIGQKPERVDGLYIESIVAGDFGSIADGVYHGTGLGMPAKRLVDDGLLRYYEYPPGAKELDSSLHRRFGSPPSEKTPADASPLPYRRYEARKDEQAIQTVTAKYGVFRSAIASPEEQKLGIDGFEVAVRNLATRQTVASTRYFFHDKSMRICGNQVDGRISEQDFLVRVLGLKK